MNFWCVLELFCTRNRYLNSFRSNFGKLWKNRFFGDFHLWDPQKWARRNFYGCRNFYLISKIGSGHQNVSSITKAAVNGLPILKKAIFRKKSNFSIFMKNDTFSNTCCFCCFFVVKKLLIVKITFWDTFLQFIMCPYLPYFKSYSGLSL